MFPSVLPPVLQYKNNRDLKNDFFKFGNTFLFLKPFFFKEQSPNRKVKLKLEFKLFRSPK